MTDRPTLPPEDDRDFHQLTGAFDRPVAPSPAFAERLKQRVVDAQHEHGATDMHAHTAMEPRVSRMTDSRVIPMPPQRSGGSIMEMIAAAVLIFALVSSGFYLYRIQNGTTPTDPDGQRLAATTPLATPTPVSDESGTAWTDPGHTNAYPAGFDPATAQPAEPLGDMGFNSDSGIIVGDTLILTGLPADVDPATDTSFETTVVGVDLATGGQLWSAQRDIAEMPVAGRDAFYTIEMPSFGEDAITFNLVSVDPHTGKTNWEQTLFESTSSDNLSLMVRRPVATGDLVYIADGIGNITAYDAASGEIAWRSGDDYFTDFGGAPFGSLVGNEEYLFVVNHMNDIVKHDASTGEIVDTFSLEHYRSQGVRLLLSLSGDRLVVMALGPVVLFEGSEYEDFSNINVRVDVLDTTHGESLWSADLGGYPAGSAAVTDTLIAIPQHHSDDATPATAHNSSGFIVEFYDLETGELVADYLPALTRGVSLSASGSVVCIHESASAISCDNMADHQFDPTAIDVTADYLAEGPPSPILFWNDSAIVLGHEGGPHIIRSGNPSSEATPEASPTSIDTEPARGGSFGTDASLDPTFPENALPSEPLASAWKQEVSAPKWMMPYGTVIAVLGTSELAVYDDLTGEELWSQPVSEVLRDRLADDAGNPEFILAMHAGPMALPWIEGETLYVTTPSELVGLDLMTGVETFRTPHHSGDLSVDGSGGKLPAGLAIADGVAYVQAWPDVSGDVPVSAIDLTSGDILWSTPLQGPPQGNLAVDGGLIILTVRAEDGNCVVALDIADGSVAWTVEDALSEEDQGRLDGTTLFITDGTIVQTRMTTTGQEEPSSDPADALRIAAYELDTGDVLWTSRSDDPSWGLDPDAINGCGFFPRVSDGALLIPCWKQDMSSMDIVALPIDGDGTAETLEALSGLPGATSMGFVASETAWIYGTDEEIVHLDLTNGTTTSMGTMGGVACDQRTFPTDNGLACLTTDGLGTYFIQVFAPDPESHSTPDAASDATPISVDPGNTGRLGDDAPGIDNSILMTTREDDAGISPPVDAVVSGNYLITQDFSSETPLQVRDLKSGDVLWASDVRPLGRLVADSERLYLVVPADNPGGTSNLLVLEISTGEIAWSRPAFAGFDISGLGVSGPVVTGKLVLLVDSFGNTMAVHRETGDLAWRYPESQIFTMPNTLAGGMNSYSSIVATDENAFVTTPTNELLKLDLDTGQLVGSIDLASLIGDSPIIATLHASGDRLAMMVYRQSSDRPGNTSLVLFDTNDLEKIAQREISQRSSIPVAPVLSNDAILIPVEDASAFEISVHAFDLDTGDVRDPVYIREGLGVVHLSLAGNALLVSETYTNNEISKIDLDSGNAETWVIEPGLRPHQRGQELGPILLWDGKPLIVRGTEQLVEVPIFPASDVDMATPISTPDATPDATPVSGDPNYTSAWPAEFDLSGLLVAQPIDGYRGHAASGVVVGDVLIAENMRLAVNDPPTFSGTGIYAQDLRTGEILWRNTDHINDRYTADESGVYVVPQPTTNRQHLIALDPETGDERWRSEQLSDFSSYPEDAPFLHALNPVVIDGFVYVPFVDGTILAFDGASGEVVWQYTPDEIADVDDVHGHASVAGTSDRIYAANGANVVSVLDRESGDLVREIRLDDVPVDGYRTDLIARDGHLLVQASSTGSGETGGRLIVLDPETGEERWRQDTNVMVSNVLVTPATVGVMHVEYDPANLVERVILDEDLEGTTELSLLDIDTGEPMEVPDGVFSPIEGVWSGALAASGETICVAYTTVTCFDQDGQVTTVQGFGTEEVSAPQGLVFWNGSLVILDTREPIHIVTEP